MSKRKKVSVPEGIPVTIKVTDTLDLHGLFPEQIPEIMDAFLKNASDLELKRVRVIHGKGKSRLKFEVYEAIKNHDLVSRYYDSPPESGGWGSTTIELIS